MRVWKEIFSTRDTNNLKHLFFQNQIDYLVLEEPYFNIIADGIKEPYRITSNINENALKKYINNPYMIEFCIAEETFRIYSVEELFKSNNNF